MLEERYHYPCRDSNHSLLTSVLSSIDYHGLTHSDRKGSKLQYGGLKHSWYNGWRFEIIQSILSRNVLMLPHACMWINILQAIVLCELPSNSINSATDGSVTPALDCPMGALLLLIQEISAQFLARRPGILTGIFYGFPQYFQANPKIIIRIF
jgi:hypothetical protein